MSKKLLSLVCIIIESPVYFFLCIKMNFFSFDVSFAKDIDCNVSLLFETALVQACQYVIRRLFILSFYIKPM
jgi:hypothetical protein